MTDPHNGGQQVSDSWTFYCAVNFNSSAHHGGLSLSREYLLALNNRVHHDPDFRFVDFPPGLTRNNTKPLRKRGRKGGVRQKLYIN